MATYIGKQLQFTDANGNVFKLIPIDSTLKGSANGVAELDENGKVPSSQLPSYIDDVAEYSSHTLFPETGEAGKIYIDTTANLTYRWSGSDYVEIASSLALGETSATAYRGDRGAIAFMHAVNNKGYRFDQGFYKIQTNGEGHVIGVSPVTKSDLTALGVPGQDTTYEILPAVDEGELASLVSTGEKYAWNHKADEFQVSYDSNSQVLTLTI